MDASTRSGTRIQWNAVLELLFERTRKQAGLIDVADLGLIPQDQLDVPQSAAEHGDALRFERLADLSFIGE